MAGDGPTTAGSIVGKLKMDRDQWNRMKAATLADVAALESLDPKIIVKMNARDARLEMEELAEAVDEVTDSERELGDETDRTTSKTIKANDANRTTVTRMGMIATAVGALLPLLSPVAAVAVGVGGAFLGMGAAGVFALVGINQQMDQGTALGRQYASGVGSMKAALSQLAGTAAANMLTSFNRVVRETNDALPFLNRQIGSFSQILGRAGATAFSGAITSLKVLNPLFMTAALWVEQLAIGFDRWASNGGLEQFAAYAMTALPSVLDMLGALSAVVMHVLQALVPLGAIGVAALTGIANVINAIPVDVLSNLIGMITWGTIAFKAWGFIAPMLSGIAMSMGAVGAATTIATGPIGWVVAGLGALAAIISIAAANTRGASAAVADYTYAVQQDNGAIAENVRLKAAQKLVDSGAADAARKLGIDRQLLMSAVLGETGAQKELNAELAKGRGDAAALGEAAKAAGLSLTEYGLATQTVKQSVNEAKGGIAGAIEAYKLQKEVTGETTEATALQRAELERNAAAAGVSVEAYQAVDASQVDLASQTERTTAQMYIQNDAAGLLRQALDLLNGKQLDAAQAQNQFEQQLVNLPSFMDEATGAVDANAASLSGMSESAVQNRGNLLGLIESSQLTAEALRNQGVAGDELRNRMVAMRQQIIDEMVARGANRDEVTKYVEELYKIPETIPKTKIEVDTANAEAALARLTVERQVNIIAKVVGGSVADRAERVLQGGANGLTIPGLAGGGTGGMVRGPGNAHSDTAGVFRLAAGEEVTSNRFGQASRHRGLLKQLNAGVVAPMLPAGASREATATAGRPQVANHHTHHWHVTSNDGMQLSQQFANRQTQLGG